MIVLSTSVLFLALMASRISFAGIQFHNTIKKTTLYSVNYSVLHTVRIVCTSSSGLKASVLVQSLHLGRVTLKYHLFVQDQLKKCVSHDCFHIVC